MIKIDMKSKEDEGSGGRDPGGGGSGGDGGELMGHSICRGQK